jgi:hypothetical protein
MADIGTLVVKMAADSAQMRSELDRVKKELGKTEGALSSISGSLKGIGGIVAGAFTVSAVAAFASRVNTAADSLNDLAGKLNVSASSLNTIQLAAQQSGGTVDGVTTAFQAMNNKLGEAASGQAASAAAFKQIGLQASDLARLAPDETFRKITERISQMQNPYQRAAAAQDIFGKGARDIQGLLNEGTSAIDEARAALERHGAALSDLDVARIGVMNDELGAQSVIVQNLSTKVLAGFAPSISIATSAFGDLLESVGGATSAGRLLGITFTGTIKGIQMAGSAMYSAFSMVKSVAYSAVGSILLSLEKLVGGFAWVADKLGLDVAQRLYAARDAISGIGDSMQRTAAAAATSAVRAGFASADYARELLNSAAIYDAAAARMESSAASRMGFADSMSGAASGGKAGKAGAQALTPDQIRERDQMAREAAFKRQYEVTLQHYSALELAATNHANVLTTIDAQSAAARINVASSFEYFRADIAHAFGLQQLDFEAIKNASIIDLAGELFTSLAGANTKLFKVQQGFAIANAVINTAQGITEALKLPFPASLAAAAKVAVAGAIQVAKIRSTVPGGSANVATGGLSGASASTPALPQTPGNASQADQSQRVAQVNIYGSVFSSRETADWLVEQLSDAINNRDVVFINGNSRQAGLIAGT